MGFSVNTSFPTIQLNDHNRHLLSLGGLLANLNVLEGSLRMFLCNHHKENWAIPAKGEKVVPETHLTNHDSLTKIVKKYNIIAPKSFNVDSQIVFNCSR
jgi:hypothetical protein